TGFYAGTHDGWSTGVENGPLHALSDAIAGGNGVYRYSAATAFPSQTFQAGNYWVDVVYAVTLGPDTTPPTVVSSTPSAGATGISVGSTVTTTFSEGLTPTAGNRDTLRLQACTR